jgi:hypothetical protein
MRVSPVSRFPFIHDAMPGLERKRDAIPRRRRQVASKPSRERGPRRLQSSNPYATGGAPLRLTVDSTNMVYREVLHGLHSNPKAINQ